MGRLDWDRLRRARALDNAEPHLDADGGFLWEKRDTELAPAFGTRRLRHGVIVRRRRAVVSSS